MTSDRARRMATCFAFAMMSIGALLVAQDKPDFSGSWTVESPPPGTEIPRTLSVSQSLVRTNALGQPTLPFFKDITVTRTLATGVRSDKYQIGVVSGNVPGPGVDRPRTHRRVVWQGQALVIESGSHSGSVPESGVWAERREVWSLEPDGRLRLAVTTRASGDAPESIVLIYRRQ